MFKIYGYLFVTSCLPVMAQAARPEPSGSLRSRKRLACAPNTASGIGLIAYNSETKAGAQLRRGFDDQGLSERVRNKQIDKRQTESHLPVPFHIVYLKKEILL